MRLLPLFILLGLVGPLSAQCPTLVWSDEFDGNAVNTENWNYDLGDGCAISQDLCGWGNQEQQWYTEENATVADGKLSITVKQERRGNSGYTSSRLTTKNKQDFRYGYLEARIKLPEAGGTWPAFWMLSTDEVYGEWPQSGEIDIMEWVGNKPEEVFGTIHFGQAFPNNQFIGGEVDQRYESWAESYHDFAIEWTNSEINWYVDGYFYSSKDRGDVSPQRWPFDQDFHFLLNVAIGGTLGGQVDNAALPTTMEVDHVRVYDTAPATMRGPRESDAGETVIYIIDDLPDNASVEWSGPEGAIISSFAGNPRRVEITMGSTGGTITATITGGCETRTLQSEVFVRPALVRDVSLENFDDRELITFEFANGELTEVANLAPDAVNGASQVGRYVRNGTTEFDVLVYGTSAIDDARVFTEGDRQFSIDVWTEAPVGTQLLLQLETNNAEAANYPTGRFARFTAATTKRGEWERLSFTLLDQPDTGATANPRQVSKLVMLFKPDSRTGDTYFWDNLDIYAPNATSVRTVSQLAIPMSALPNPVNDRVAVRYTLPEASMATVSLFNAAGQRVLTETRELPAGAFTHNLSLRDLPAGVYVYRLELPTGFRTLRLVKR